MASSVSSQNYSLQLLSERTFRIDRRPTDLVQVGCGPGKKRRTVHAVDQPDARSCGQIGPQVRHARASKDDRIRAILPSLTHDRAYRPPAAARAEAAE